MEAPSLEKPAALLSLGRFRPLLSFRLGLSASDGLQMAEAFEASPP